MFRSIAYLTAFAAALFIQSSDAGVVNLPVQMITRRKLVNTVQHVSTPTEKGQSSSSTGKIKLKYSKQDTVFVGDLQIGTPPQTFKVFYGTGSMVIWAPNYKVSKHAVYDHSASSTYVKNGTYYQVIYGDSLVTGYIMEASNVTGFTGYDDASYDGIFGLGLDVENPYMLANPVQKLALDGKLDKPEIAFYLGRNSPEITLGGVNKERFTGEINYVPVQSTGAWWLFIDEVKAGNTTVLNETTYTQVDTGSSGMGAPTAQLAVLATAVGAKQTPDGDYTISCDSTGPTISITLAGKPYTFDKADYTVRGDHGKCFFAIGDSGDYWLLGNMFMQKYYTVFDFGTNTTDPRVGFAHTV